MGKAEQGPEPEHEAEPSKDVFTEPHPGGRLQQWRRDVGPVTLENGANLRNTKFRLLLNRDKSSTESSIKFMLIEAVEVQILGPKLDVDNKGIWTQPCQSYAGLKGFLQPVEM